MLSLFVNAAYAQHVAVVNGKAISNKEFMWFFKRNHAGNANATYSELETCLNLYIDFKLKVLDAREAGMDRDTSYLREIENYEAALRAQKRISKTSAEYSFIMNEYKEAVLMFNISEKKIWERAQNDEHQLRNFYDQHKSAYGTMAFEEARGQVIADYQRKMEEDWVTVLRKRFPTKRYQDELKKLAKL